MIVFTILRVAEFIYSLSLSDNKHEVYPYIIKKKRRRKIHDEISNRVKPRIHCRKVTYTVHVVNNYLKTMTDTVSYLKI